MCTPDLKSSPLCSCNFLSDKGVLPVEQGHIQNLSESELKELLGYNVMPGRHFCSLQNSLHSGCRCSAACSSPACVDAVFRLVFAQMAASCAALDEALTKASDSLEVRPCATFPCRLLIASIVDASCCRSLKEKGVLGYNDRISRCPVFLPPAFGGPDTAVSERACPAQQHARLRVMMEPSWAVLEFELASVLHCIVNSYWSRMQAGKIFRPTLQVHPTGGHVHLVPSCSVPHVHPAYASQPPIISCPIMASARTMLFRVAVTLYQSNRRMNPE